MKHRNQLVRVLLLVLSVAMVLSLAACASNKDLDATKAELEKQIEELKNSSKNELQSNATADAAVKAALEEAKALLDTVKGTADAAATKAALEKVASDLASVKATADAAATKLALDAAIDDLEDLETLVGANKTAVDNAIAELNTAVDALEAADVETAAKIAAVETGVNNALTEIGTVKTELEGQINAAKNELQGNIDALATRVAAIENASTASDIATLQTAVAALQTAVANLESKDFFADYKLVTKILAGDVVTVGDVTYNGEGENDPQYSVEAFIAAIEDIDVMKFSTTEIEKYFEKADYYYFMLIRATTVAEIEACFAGLQTAKGDMKTLEASLREQLDAYYGINNQADGLLSLDSEDSVYAIADTYLKLALTVTFTETPELVDLKADYDAFMAAYENLLAAQAAADSVFDAVEGTQDGLVALIEKVAPNMVIYGQFDDIVALRDNFNTEILAAFFSDEALNIFYAKKAEDNSIDVSAIAASVVSNYAKLTKMEDRKAALETAAQEIEGFVLTDNIMFNGCTPLYSSYNALVNQKATFDTWKVTYALETENVNAICQAKFGQPNADQLVDTALVYATAMWDIYVAHNVNNVDETTGDPVADRIVGLVEELSNQHKTAYGSLYNQYAKAEGVYNRIVALEAAVAAKANALGFAAIDGNFAAMQAEFKATEFDAVWTRMTALKTADDAVKAIVAEMQAMYDEASNVNNINFGSHKIIEEQFDAGLAEIETLYAIVDDEALTDDNYDLILANAALILQGLYDEYNYITEDIALVYAKATWLMKEMEGDHLLLKKGNEVDAISQQLADLILKIGVTDAGIKIDVREIVSIEIVDLEEVITYKKDDSTGKDVYTEVVLNTLNNNFNTLVTAYEAFANEAQTEAAAVTALIDALSDNTRNLKNRAAFEEAYTELCAWIAAYLPAGTIVDNAKAELEAIQAIKIFGTTDLYQFVTVENFEKTVAAKAASELAYADAKAVAEDLIARMNGFLPVAGDRVWDIHSDDMANIVNESVAYLVEFYGYGDDLTVANLFDKLDTETYDFFTEIALLNGAFKTEYLDYAAKCAAAEGEAADILQKIKDLLAANANGVAMGTAAADVKAAADAIQLEVDAFYLEYCDDDCYFTESDVNYAIELVRIAARAELAAKFYEKSLTLNDNDRAELNTAFTQANITFDQAETREQIAATLSYNLTAQGIA